MRQTIHRFTAAAVAIAGIAAGTVLAAQTQTQSTETKRFEVVAVDGNKVVVKDQNVTKEITVPPDFRLTVDGRPVTVAELKPGMTGTATITTTTTTTPVTVTEVRNGEVMQATGNSLMVRTPEGIKMFTPGDVQKRNVKIIKDGKPVDFSALHAGDRLSATIITEGPPQVMTERQVQAALSSPATAAAAATGAAAGKVAASAGAAANTATRAGAAPSAPATPAESSGARRLPKTASTVPLMALTGLVSLAVALILARARRGRAS